MSEEEKNLSSGPAKSDPVQSILDLISQSLTPIALRRRLSRYHENDLADALLRLDAASRKKLLLVLDNEMLSQALEHMEPDERSLCINEVDIHKAANILSMMEADDILSILRDMDEAKRQLVIELLDPEVHKDLVIVGSYDDSQIGSKMETNYIEIDQNCTVPEAMKALLEQAQENDNINTLFVQDEKGVYSGAIDIRDLIIARRNTKLDDIIKPSYPYVYGSEKIDDIIETIKDYSEDSIPVLNADNKIQGVITSQNLIQVVDDALSEDYARLAGLRAEEDIKEPVWKSVTKRLPWLVILLCLGMLVSSVVGVFEGIVATLPLLLAFQSTVLDMAGNVGTQSLAVTIRILTDESLNLKQKIWLVFREGRIGFFNGLILGCISFLVVGIFIYLTKERNLLYAFSISACIGFAMQIAMLVSSVLGTGIPEILKSLKIDPAVASGPLITTLSDLTSVVTYYSLCWIILIEMMHFGS